MFLCQVHNHRSNCGSLSGPSGLGGLTVRRWTCGCGAEHDRDCNAAMNALIVGLGMSHERVREHPPGIRQVPEVHTRCQRGGKVTEPTEVGSTSEQFREQGYENLVINKKIDPLNNWGIAVPDKDLTLDK
jgi:hypothetical protein